MDWSRKQARLREFLVAHGAEKAPYRVDFHEGKIFWVNPLGLSLVVADCKMICSYALSNRSILMAWANESVSSEIAVGEIEGLPGLVNDCKPHDVWALSKRVGESVDAAALFRAPSPQSWVMLALWRPRPGGGEQFKSGSPRKHIHNVLRKLAEHSNDGERRVLLDNYAESFLQLASQAHKGTKHEASLRSLSRTMRNLLALSIDDMTSELEQLSKDWDVHTP